MVRFSDVLGGNESPEEQPEDDESPEDVLERLTQYATSSRTADPVLPAAPAVPPSAEPESTPAEPAVAQESDAASSFAPVADDLLPRSKSRKGRGGRS